PLRRDGRSFGLRSVSLHLTTAAGRDIAPHSPYPPGRGPAAMRMRTPALNRALGTYPPEANLFVRRGADRAQHPLEWRQGLVTGASSELGADLARELAGRGAGLVLVVRREDRLRALERELVDRHGATVDVAVLDPRGNGAPEELRRRVADAGRPSCWSTTPAMASTAGSSS